MNDEVLILGGNRGLFPRLVAFAVGLIRATSSLSGSAGVSGNPL